MLYVTRRAPIVGVVLLAGFLILPAKIAKAQLPTAPYQVIDLYTMSAANLEYDQLSDFSSYHYEQLAAGGKFAANTTSFALTSLSATANAYVWNTTSYPTTMNPTGTGFPYAHIAGTDGLQQVGVGFGSGGGLRNVHATVWGGTAASAIDLNPSQLGATSSFAFGVKDGQQVGYSAINSNPAGTATLWNGSAASAVLLSPPSGYAETYAIATDGVHQVGYSVPNAGGKHAVMWTGSAASMIDLEPAGLGVSEAVTVAGGQEGGYAIDINQRVHPGIWTGSADSFVDLTPPSIIALNHDFSGSVTSTNGVQQVGFVGNGASYGNPLIWSGTADSAELLPTFGTGDIFTPYDIDDFGNVFGIAVDPSGNLTAIEWVPTPEPGSIGLFACISFGFLLGRRKRA